MIRRKAEGGHVQCLFQIRRALADRRSAWRRILGNRHRLDLLDRIQQQRPIRKHHIARLGRLTFPVRLPHPIQGSQHKRGRDTA